jgi:hypothetical protein
MRLIVVLLVLLPACGEMQREWAEYVAACERAGGKVYHGRDSFICYQPVVPQR